MTRPDPEVAHLTRDVLALPERQRVEVFENLRKDLAAAAGPSKIVDLNERTRNAIEAFNRVADHLGRDSDLGKLTLKMREFDAAPTTVRQASKHAISRLFSTARGIS